MINNVSILAPNLNGPYDSISMVGMPGDVYVAHGTSMLWITERRLMSRYVRSVRL
jgi:hypothetical protein